MFKTAYLTAILLTIFMQASSSQTKKILIIIGSAADSARAEKKGIDAVSSATMQIKGYEGESTIEIADSIKAYFEKNECSATVVRSDEPAAGITEADLIVIGSSIVAGSPNKTVTAFIDSNRTILSKKKVAVFAACAFTTSSRKRKKARSQKYADKVANGLSTISTYVFAGYIPDAGGFLNFVAYRLMFGVHHGDFRDWELIERWSKYLLEQINE